MIDLKKEFGEDFYNDLIKCDFLKDLDEILNTTGIINIDLNDVKNVARGDIVGAISMSINDSSEKLVFNRINDKNISSAIINIVTKEDAGIIDISNILEQIRDICKDVNMIYGTYIDSNLNKAFKIQALFTNK